MLPRVLWEIGGAPGGLLRVLREIGGALGVLPRVLREIGGAPGVLNVGCQQKEHSRQHSLQHPQFFGALSAALPGAPRFPGAPPGALRRARSRISHFSTPVTSGWDCNTLMVDAWPPNLYSRRAASQSLRCELENRHSGARLFWYPLGFLQRQLVA